MTQRLGKNHDGYHGETIDIKAVLRELQTAVQAHKWSSETYHTHAGFEWFALHRPSRTPQVPRRLVSPKPGEGGSFAGAGHASRIHISAGTHGDEPAGPLAALKLIQENRWPDNAEIFLVPCINPLGFTKNQRANADGIDVNRDYRNPKSAEARTHIAWLERQPRFDLYLCLHEDWESHGFYLYETNPDDRPSFAQNMIDAVVPVCPVDMSEVIEDRPAKGGIIRPKISPQERPDWPEALYHIMHTSRQGYTLEAPSDFPLPSRVNALVAAVTAGLASFCAQRT